MNPDLPQDEPNYKALYTELKGEVLEKVGPFAELVVARGDAARIWEEDRDHWKANDHTWGGQITVGMVRALSSLHEKLSSIGGSSSTETAASLADGKLTAGEAQRKSEWRTIDSAPRDGTWVLVCLKTEGGNAGEDNLVYGPWPPVQVAQWEIEDGAGMWNVPFVDHWLSDDAVAAWQPLPPPPNPSARGEL